MALFSDRFLVPESCLSLHKDWITFVGMSLKNFCTENQLVIELRAFAESLEKTSWSKISYKYSEIISEICNEKYEDYDTCSWGALFKVDSLLLMMK